MTDHAAEASADAQAMRQAVSEAGLSWIVAPASAGGYPAPYAEHPVAFRPARGLGWMKGLFTEAAPPPSRDWSQERRLTPAGEQGAFNTCSAFAVTGIVSDLVAISTNAAPRPLSAGHVHRCLGGLPPERGADPHALAVALTTRTAAAEEAGDYPFDAGACAAASGVQGIAEVSVIARAEEAKAAMEAGPVLAVMNLYDDFWPWYGGGVYEPLGRYQSSHSIIVVGYDDPGGYWIVRNSHGPGWGIGGYGKIRYGACGLFGFHRGLRLHL